MDFESFRFMVGEEFLAISSWSKKEVLLIYSLKYLVGEEFFVDFRFVEIFGNMRISD